MLKLLIVFQVSGMNADWVSVNVTPEKGCLQVGESLNITIECTAKREVFILVCFLYCTCVTMP